MKQLLLFATLIVLYTSGTAQSFDRSYLRNDLMISYGIPSTDMFLDIKSSMLDDKFQDSRYLRDNYGGSGIAALTYRRVSKSEMFFWGIGAAYNTTKGEIYFLGNHEGELKRSFITIAFEGHYRYQNLKKVQLYSGIGFGYSLGSETLTPPAETGNPAISGNINRIAYQINAIGIRIGNNIGGFLELGYGYKGIVNVGFSVQLL